MPSKYRYLTMKQGVFEGFKFEMKKKAVQLTFFESDK